MEYYSAIKNNEIMPFAAIWMDLEIIILSEVSQRKTKIIWDLLKKDTKELTIQKQTQRFWNQTYGYQGGNLEVGNKLRGWD